jgi:hypothetical protein
MEIGHPEAGVRDPAASRPERNRGVSTSFGDRVAASQKSGLRLGVMLPMVGRPRRPRPHFLKCGYTIRMRDPF